VNLLYAAKEFVKSCAILSFRIVSEKQRTLVYSEQKLKDRIRSGKKKII